METTIAVIRRFATLVVAAAVFAACSVDSQQAPALIGPSGFALSLTLSATPDVLPRDGSSQAVVKITVRNESGQPVSGRRVTLSASAGTLSASEVVTGSDGQATFVLTAPPAGTTGNTIQISATPVGSGSSNVTRFLSIALSGISNTTAPSPQFTVEPTAPGAGEQVTFDASGTTDEGSVCSTACTYSWNIGGTTKTGIRVTHTFSTAGVYVVKLTVTDPAGTVATTERNLTVSTLAAPSVTLTVSPSPPQLSKQATFTATATAAPGHSIVKYEWTFGDGSAKVTTTTPTVNHTFTAAGLYIVTVTATDDVGQTGSQSLQVSVSNVAPPTVTFTVSPTSPLVGQTATFTATATPATGHSVTQYKWNFGDGSAEATTSSRTINHTFTDAGVHVVTVTATDDLGQTGSATASVTVTTGVVVDIRVSPTNPKTGDTVRFDPTGSTIPAGITVKEYVWNFGNGSTAKTTPSSPIASTTYSDARTYTIRLDIVDTEGRTTTGFTTLVVAAP